MLIGLVGKPSVGKSTFFKAMTLAEVEIANYPFTTIAPNKGAGHARLECVDKEFKVQCNPSKGFCMNHYRFVPVELMDVAGLIEGSYQGLGKGNEFLNDIREADALIHVVDISGSTNEKGEPVNPLSHDPTKDIKFLEYELDMWYLGILKKGWGKFTRTIKQENQDIKKAIAKQLSGLKVNELMVQHSINELNLIHHPMEWSEDDLFNLARELRKLTKPTVIAANKIDVPGSKLNLEKAREKYKEYKIIPCSADAEIALKEAAKNKLIEYVPGDKDFKVINDSKLNDRQIKALEFIRKNVLEEYGSTGVQEVLDKAVFDLLGYIAIFPGGLNKLEDSKGRILPDCFLMKKDATALDFAFALHTDIGDNFIKAIDVKTKRVVGKDHKLKHRDVVEIAVKK